MLVKAYNQLNPLLPASCCICKQVPSTHSLTGRSLHNVVKSLKRYKNYKQFQCYSFPHYDLLRATKNSCSLYLVGKEESDEFLNRIISQFVAGGTSPCASLTAKLQCDAPPSMQSHRWKALSDKSSGLLLKEQVVCTQCKGKARCCGERTSSTLASERSCPQAERHVRRYFIFPFLFKLFSTTNRYSRDAE